MRRALLASAAVFFGLGAQSAWADVDVTAFITKTKTISITEFLLKFKTVIVDVEVVITPD